MYIPSFLGLPGACGRWWPHLPETVLARQDLRAYGLTHLSSARMGNKVMEQLQQGCRP